MTSDVSIEFNKAWSLLQKFIRYNYGEEIQFYWIEHLQGGKERINRHIIQYGANKLDREKVDKFWKEHYLSMALDFEEIKNPKKAITYVAGYVSLDEKFIKARHSQGWLFRGCDTFCRWHRKFFGWYPYDEYLIELSLMSPSERLEDELFDFYIEIKEKGLERMVAEADARFRISPSHSTGRVRLIGEPGEQLILPDG